MAIEPFGVPTGSMAPTLIGNHKVAACPRCGFVIRVGDAGKSAPQHLKVACPNCGVGDIDICKAPDIAGDRLLVDKNIFTLRRPQRWEPAVFRCPSDLTKPYVKRVIGLPGEKILIQGGDVFIDGHLARKSLRQAFETRVPLFDMSHVPPGEGWAKRWVIESKLPAPAGKDEVESTLKVAGNELHLYGLWASQVPIWIAYKHHRFDDTVNTEREEIIRDAFIYNGVNAENNAEPVHDFLAEFELEVVGGVGAFYCRMSDGADYVTAECPVGGAKRDAELKSDGKGGLSVIHVGPQKPLQEKKIYRIRMAFVDRRASFAVNGSEPAVSVDLDAVPTRADVASPLAFGVRGVNVIVRQLKIDRDIYYRSDVRGINQNGVNEKPYQLGSNEYFMLGDNSANSDDSRYWPIPGVPEKNFLGKPFLLHQPSRMTHLTVNGRERLFQSIDWSRIRFLR